MMNFLETAVVFLLMTNAASVMIATYAMRVAKAFSPWQQHARTAVERKLDALLRRGAAGRSGVVRKTTRGLRAGLPHGPHLRRHWIPQGSALCLERR